MIDVDEIDEPRTGGRYQFAEPDNDCWIPATALSPERRAAILAKAARWCGPNTSGALINPRVTIGGIPFRLTVARPPQD